VGSLPIRLWNNNATTDTIGCVDRRCKIGTDRKCPAGDSFNRSGDMKHFIIHYYSEGADWREVMRAESLEEVIQRTLSYGKVIEIFEMGPSVYKATDLPSWLSSSIKEECYTKKR